MKSLALVKYYMPGSRQQMTLFLPILRDLLCALSLESLQVGLSDFVVRRMVLTSFG
jgi:hypothetical protein